MHLLAAYPEMMTGNEVAAVLRIDPRSVQRHAKAGQLVAMQLGRSYRIPKAEVLRWMLAASTASTAGTLVGIAADATAMPVAAPPIDS